MLTLYVAVHRRNSSFGNLRAYFDHVVNGNQAPFHCCVTLTKMSWAEPVECSVSLTHFISQKWGQAHAQGRFAILRVLQEANMVDVKIVTGNDGKPDLLLTLDRKMIHKEGKEAIGNFLKRLQVRGDFQC